MVSCTEKNKDEILLEEQKGNNRERLRFKTVSSNDDKRTSQGSN